MSDVTIEEYDHGLHWSGVLKVHERCADRQKKRSAMNEHDLLYYEHRDNLAIKVAMAGKTMLGYMITMRNEEGIQILKLEIDYSARPRYISIVEITKKLIDDAKEQMSDYRFPGGTAAFLECPFFVDADVRNSLKHPEMGFKMDGDSLRYYIPREERAPTYAPSEEEPSFPSRDAPRPLSIPELLEAAPLKLKMATDKEWKLFWLDERSIKGGVPQFVPETPEKAEHNYNSLYFQTDTPVPDRPGAMNDLRALIQSPSVEEERYQSTPRPGPGKLIIPASWMTQEAMDRIDAATPEVIRKVRKACHQSAIERGQEPGKPTINPSREGHGGRS